MPLTEANEQPLTGAGSEAQQPLSVTYVLPGTAPTCYNTVAQLQARGHRVRFDVGLFFNRPDDHLRWLPLPSALRHRINRQLRRRSFPGIEASSVHRHPLFETLHLLAARSRLPRRLVMTFFDLRNHGVDRAVAGSLQQNRPDVVIGKDESSLNCLRAAKPLGILGVLNQVIGHYAVGQELLAEEAERHPEFADSLGLDFDKDRQRRLIEHTTAEALEAELILAPSDYVIQTLLQIGCNKENLALLPYGVDVERFTVPAERTNRPFRILYVGQISQRKGIKYLLEAYRQLGLKDAELRLVGPITGSREALAPYRDLFSHVDSVPYQEIHRYYREASVFILPSLHEGSATVLYEALASGIPIITTANSGSVVQDGVEGYIVPVGDIEALKDRMLQLYDDTDRLNQMSLAARQRACKYTWDRFGERLDSILYNRLEDRKSC